MSVRRMTSYRLFLLRAALGRIGRAIAYYWVSMRAQLRMWRSSYHVTLMGQRIRGVTSATGRLLRRLPRQFVALLGLVAWFLGQLSPYVRRVLADYREDRAELHAERRLLAAERRAQRAARREVRTAASAERRAESAERRARRQAELAEIKTTRTARPHHLSVPAWISRMERPQRPQRERRAVPAPRRALVAAAITMLAAVPAYSIVSGALSSGDLNGAVPDVAAAPGAAAAPATGTAAPGQPAAPGTSAGGPTGPVTVSGDTGEFVRTLPALPTPVPRVPAPRLVVSSSAAPGTGTAIVGSLTNPLSEHQEREARRQAKWDAKLARAAERAAAKEPGK